MRDVRESRDLERELKAIEVMLDKNDQERRKLHDSRERIWHRYVRAKFHVGIGDRVTCERSSIRRPKPVAMEYEVCSIGYQVGSGGRPWLTGKIVRKDGTVSERRIPLYEDWSVMISRMIHRKEKP